MAASTRVKNVTSESLLKNLAKLLRNKCPVLAILRCKYANILEFGSVHLRNKFKKSNECKCKCTCDADDNTEWIEAIEEDMIELSNDCQKPFDMDEETIKKYGGYYNYARYTEKLPKLEYPITVLNFEETCKLMKIV